MAEGKLCRWGILSTAGIARKNWKAMRNAGNSILTAVASRRAEAAQQFITECQASVPFTPAPQAFGSYEALLASPEVDAVYIPLPTGTRREWVIRAAQAGKHVLAEKPAARSAAELDEMLAACREHGVQYMDGVMFMHSQRLPLIRQVLDAGEIGDIKRIATQFSFCAPDEFLRTNIRTNSDLEPQGCLGDLGWYTIRFILWCLQGQLPQAVTGRILSTLQRADSPQPVPGEFSAELLFAGGVSASFYTSFRTENQQWAHVSGTRGSLHVPDFVLPRCGNEVEFTVSNDVFDVQGCEFHMRKHERRFAVAEYDAGLPNAQETHLIRCCSQLVLDGRPSDEWPRWTKLTQQVLDACLQSAREQGRVVPL